MTSSVSPKRSLPIVFHVGGRRTRHLDRWHGRHVGDVGCRVNPTPYGRWGVQVSGFLGCRLGPVYDKTVYLPPILRAPSHACSSTRCDCRAKCAKLVPTSLLPTTPSERPNH